MGKKGGWFFAVKKALSPQSKKDQRAKYRKKSNAENKTLDTANVIEQVKDVDNGLPPAAPQQPSPISNSTEVVKIIDDEESRHAYSVAIATAAAAKAAIAAAQAAAEIVRLTTVPRFMDKSKEEISAIKIQTAFRGYLARRTLRALRGLVRLKILVENQSVKRQSETTLRCMQTLARVQSQIRSRRIRMSEENQVLQRQLQHKHEKELEKMRRGETWDDSTQSKEQIEASLQNKQEAAMRRERALAYAFTHQQPKKNKNSNPIFMDPNNPQWGWSWLERWMATRPWESRSIAEKESNDPGSVKSFRTLSVAGEINRAYALCDISNGNIKNKPIPTTGQRSSRPPSRQSPSTASRAQSLTPGSKKARPGSPKAQDEDMKSTMSKGTEKFRRHSITGSSVRDNVSFASSPSIPSRVIPTRSAKTKMPSPLGVVEKSKGTPPFVGSTKKRMSFPASAKDPRRHSVPGKFESSPVKDVPVQIFVSN